MPSRGGVHPIIEGEEWSIQTCLDRQKRGMPARQRAEQAEQAHSHGQSQAHGTCRPNPKHA